MQKMVRENQMGKRDRKPGRKLGKVTYRDKPHQRNHVDPTELPLIKPTASGFNAGNFIAVGPRNFNRFEVAKITKQNVWWNYASQKDLLSVYKLAMLNSGKTLARFSLESLVEFIEANIHTPQEQIDEIEDKYNIEIWDENVELTFDVLMDKVVVARSIRFHPFEWMEDFSKVRKVKNRKPENCLAEKLISCVLSEVFDVAHVYSNRLGGSDYEEFMEMICQQHGFDYIGDELCEYKDDEAEQVSYYKMIYTDGEKALKDKRHLQRTKEYQKWFDLGENKLIELTLQAMDANPKYKSSVESFQNFIAFEKRHKLFSGYENGIDLKCLSPIIITDDYDTSLKIGAYYSALIGIDIQEMSMEDVHVNYDLLSENVHTYMSHITNLKQWL
jgi:hypothetical protein